MTTAQVAMPDIVVLDMAAMVEETETEVTVTTAVGAPAHPLPLRIHTISISTNSPLSTKFTMNITIFNSIHDDFTAKIFADYFEEQNCSKIARLLLTPPSGKDTSLLSNDEYGFSEETGHGNGGGEYDDISGDGSFGSNCYAGTGTGTGYGYGHTDRLEQYHQTFHYLQNLT
jgi:hypothetical protein